MTKYPKASLLTSFLFVALAFFTNAAAQTPPGGPAIDAEVNKIMSRTHGMGMAVAVIDHGKVGYVNAYGVRNAKGDPLTAETIMYGASLTKTVFAYTVMQLVDQGKLKLDTPSRTISMIPCRSTGLTPCFRTSTGRTRILPTTRAGKRSLRACA